MKKLKKSVNLKSNKETGNVNFFICERVAGGFESAKRLLSVQFFETSDSAVF